MRNTVNIISTLFLSILMISCANAQSNNIVSSPPPPNPKELWVDSVYQTLTNREKIGQLFMVAAYSGGDNYNKEKIAKLVGNGEIGGIIFMQGTAENQIRLTNEFQENSKVPLLIGMDAEWGLGMRLTGVRNYPRQMLLGAARDASLVKQMGAEIAEQCKRVGAHIDFAPAVDVNNNPANPVINFRSFGENKEWVSQLGIAYMKGLQDNGIMASAKHFPGHGDVSVDSHLDLPIINKDSATLHELELYPFKRLIAEGVQSVMVSHLNLPAIDNTKNLPATLSYKVITNLLIEQMGFDGLVFTDALNMTGVTKYHPNGDADLKAFLAGNDVLLFSENATVGINKIEKAIEEGKTNWGKVEKSVKKILAAKYDAGLNNFQKLAPNNATADLNKNIPSFWQKAAEKSITLVKDNNDLLKKINLPEAKIGYVNINAGKSPSSMADALKKEFPQLKTLSAQSNIDNMDVVVVAIHNLRLYPGKNVNYGLNASQIAYLKSVSKKKNVIISIMGNPYVMRFVCEGNSILVGYEDNSYTKQAAVDVLSGKKKAQGTLPVTACP